MIRRLERRVAQAPGLIEPTIKTLDAALTALDDTRSHLEAALPHGRFRSGQLASASRNAFSACAPPAANTTSPSIELASLAQKYNGDIALIDAGEEKLKSWKPPQHRLTLP